MTESEDVKFARLADWVEGRLSEEEARTVEKEVMAADSSTRADVAWLQAFARISEATVIASPPPEVRDALVERFETYAESKQQLDLLERLVARLTFDSGQQPALGWRVAAAPELQRQLVYSTEAADVSLNVRPRPRDGLLDIHGRIFTVNNAYPGDFYIQLLAGSSEVATAATSNLREFVFEGVPPGVYDIIAGSDRVEIRMTGVEVRHGG
jgi:hypothetical protein